MIWNANKKSNSHNVLDFALIDSGFYERVREFGGWIYQIDEDEAKNYLSKPK